MINLILVNLFLLQNYKKKSISIQIKTEHIAKKMLVILNW